MAMKGYCFYDYNEYWQKLTVLFNNFTKQIKIEEKILGLLYFTTLIMWNFSQWIIRTNKRHWEHVSNRKEQIRLVNKVAEWSYWVQNLSKEDESIW